MRFEISSIVALILIVWLSANVQAENIQSEELDDEVKLTFSDRVYIPQIASLEHDGKFVVFLQNLVGEYGEEALVEFVLTSNVRVIWKVTDLENIIKK